MPSYPKPKVEMAFTSTQAGDPRPVGVYSDRTTWTWVDVSNWVRGLETSLGRQHELERTEASTVQLTLDNRDGRFSPWNTTAYDWPLSAGGTVSLTPASCELVTVPVRITSSWSSTSYPVLFAFVDAWNPAAPDALNQDTTVACSDLLRHLAMRRMSNATLYPNLVNSQFQSLSGSYGMNGYYRCNETSTATTLANSATTISESARLAWRASLIGTAAYGQNGAMAYDPNRAIDIGGGGQTPSGFIATADWKDEFGFSLSNYCIEGWFQNASPGDYLIANYLPGSTTLVGVKLNDNGKATIVKRVFTSGGSTDTVLLDNNLGPSVDLKDTWHLVTMQANAGTYTLYVDGQNLGSVAGPSGNLRIVSWGGWASGNTTSGTLPYAATTATVDELIATEDAYGFAAASSDRFAIGSYLRTDNELVGDRLLKVMQIAGVVPTGSTRTTAPLNLAQGYLRCQAEKADATQQAVADYALALAESEQGYLFQDQAGTIQFYDRFYPQTHAGTGKTISDGAVADARYTVNPEVVLDDLDTWNIAQTTDPSGNTTEVTNAASVTLYGPRTFSVASSWGERPQDQTALGQMVTTRFTAPKVRMTKITLDSAYTDTGGTQANIPIMLGLNPWDSLTLVRSGSSSTALTASVVVERIGHRFEAEPGHWSTDLMLSPYEMNLTTTPDSGSVFRMSGPGQTYSTFKSSGQDTFGG